MGKQNSKKDLLLPPRTVKRDKKALVQQVILFVLLAVLGIIMLIPFYWSIITSFTPKLELENGFSLIPRGFTLENWMSLFEQNWLLYIFNTVFIAFMQIFLSLLFCSMAAYVFAKFEFKGKRIIYQIMLISMMMPSIITLIPQFIVITHLPFIGGNDGLGNSTGNTMGDVGPGLLNSLWGVIMPQAVSIYGILFLRQFFVNTSDVIGDAARIDGAGEFRIFTIYLRMAIPGITTLGLFTFVSTWNSYLWPSLILYSQSKFTLGIALQEYQAMANTGEMMAGSLISIIPIIVLFMFTQKYFMKQASYTGVK